MPIDFSKEFLLSSGRLSPHSGGEPTRPSLSKILKRASILLGLCVLAGSLYGGSLLSAILKRDLAKTRANEVAGQVRGRITNHPSLTSLTSLTQASLEGLDRLSEDLSNTLGSRGLKIWDLNGRAIWSDEMGLDRRISEAENLRQALAGEVTYHWQLPGFNHSNGNNGDALGQGSVIEVYVPLLSPERQNVAYVLGIYADATPLIGPVKNVTKTLWGVGLGSGLIVYLGLLVVVRRASSDLADAAGRNAMLYDKVLEGSQRLSALHDLSQKVSSKLDLKEVLDSIVRASLELLDGDRASLFLLSEDGKHLRPTATFGQIQEPAGEPPELPVGGPPSGIVASEKKSRVVDDVQRDERWWDHAWAKAEGLRSFIGVPLISGEKLVGVLNCLSREPSKFEEEDIRLMEALASEAAIALENARLYEGVVKRSEELAGLIEASRRVASELDLKKTLEAVLDEGGRVFGTGRIGLWFVRKESGDVFDVIARGLSEEHLETIRYLKGKTIVSQYAQDPSLGQSTVVEDVSSGSRWEHQQELWLREGIRSLVVIPMRSRGETFGVLAFYWGKTKHFSEEEIALGQAFAEQAAIAIRNAQIYADVRPMRDRLETLVENAGDAIVTLDSESKVLSWNPAAERIYGYSASEMVGQVPHALFPEERQSESLAIRERMKQGKILTLVETERRRKGGETFDAQITYSPLRDPRGEVTGYSVIIRDISETKKMERELAQTNDELQRTVVELHLAQEVAIRSKKLASIGTLVAGVSHEILNPINNMSVTIQMLQREIVERTPENLSEALDSMQEEVGRVVKISDNLLKFSRQKEPRAKPVELPHLMDQVIDLLSHETRLENIEVVREYSPDLPKVRGDEDQLRQVFFNLIQNARDAMPSGGRLVLQTQVKNGWVCTSVQDTGEGIPEEVREKVFDPFFSTKPEGKGTGLGLSVSYGIIEAHKGSLTVESKDKEGTTFRVELPAMREEKENA